jgi:hypothetical protein
MHQEWCRFHLLFRFQHLIHSQTATEGEAFSYTVRAASDVEGDGLTYTAALTSGGSLPGWLSFAAGTRTFSGTPGAGDAPATLDITVTATDDGDPLASGTTSFTLTVEEAGAAPAPMFWTGAADQTAIVGEAFSYTLPEAVAAENRTLTYTVVKLSWPCGMAVCSTSDWLLNWLSFAAGTRTFSGTPGSNDVTGGRRTPSR